MALSTGRYRGAKPKPHIRPRRQEDLVQADRCIAAAKKQVGRQKEIIAGLAQAGHDTYVAESLLGAMERGLRAFETASRGRLEVAERALIPKRAPIGDNQDDYDVLENGVVVGRIFKVPVAPQDRPWMWTSGHNGEIRRGAWIRADARSRDVGVRRELAAVMLRQASGLPFR
jgi:hypothetical protein